MKEYPILMQGWGVRATLDDRKSQTRRVIKLQPEHVDAEPRFLKYEWAFWHDSLPEYRGGLIVRCPYGQPGDLLWVRETWAPWKGVLCPCKGDCNCNPFLYRADPDTEFANKCEYPNERIRWHPSIFMPKAAARIWRRITEIRAERVQDISDDDIAAEGCEPEICNTAWDMFRDLWDSINKKPKLAKRPPWTLSPEDCYVSYPWEDIQETREHRGLPWYVIGNPYVWAITSEKVDR